MQRFSLVIEMLSYVLMGVAVGLLSTIAGIGGGVFMVPLFYFIGLSISSAVGTSKFVILFISLIGSIKYLRLKRVLPRVSILVLIGMMPFSYIGALMTTTIERALLKTIVALFILLYGARLLYTYSRARRICGGNCCSSRSSGVGEEAYYSRWYLLVLVGCFSGLIAGLTGTGGGVINMPLFLSVLKIPIHYAVATSTFTIFPASITATVRHVIDEEVAYDIAIPFTIGSVIGAFIGPHIALSMKPKHLRILIGVVLVVVGIRMLV